MAGTESKKMEQSCKAISFKSETPRESATSIYDELLDYKKNLESSLQTSANIKKTEKQLINTQQEAIEVGGYIPQDELKKDEEPLEILLPEINPTLLAAVVEESNVLKQCISAYVVNIDSYGSVLEYIGEEGKREKPKNKAEYIKARTLIDCPSPTTGMSLVEIRKRFRQDLETYGNAYLEVSRTSSGEVVSIDHVPAETMRLTKVENKLVPSVVSIVDPETGKVVTRRVNRRFRRFVQIDPTNLNRKIYFKEFGDPRKIDPRDGRENNELSINDCATEIIHKSIYTPGRVYGNPRWLGVLPCILGSRESELVNLNFFRDNAIPALAVLISGGALTEESYQTIQRYITAVKGKDAMNRVLVLEASSDDSNADLTHSQPAPKVELKPMISERQQDGLFKDYDDFNMLKIRSSFRLSPLHIGRSDDYNKASAAVAMQVVESQVFLPERNAFDDMFNSLIMTTLGLNMWRYRSMGPSITDANDIVVWGNAPDYPSAGTGYVVGDHIYDLSNIRRYYEAIDGSGWSQKFKAYCEGKFNCVVKNYGMSGINSRVLLDYLSQATYPVQGYDIAIVMIGTNDRYESANIPKATSYSNICSIVDKLREHGTKVILMAATPATTVDEENASARVYHMDDVDHIIMKVASDKRVPFVSLFSAMNDYCLFTGTTLASLLNNDGLHPNDTGYAVMYRLILRELGIPKRDDVQ